VIEAGRRAGQYFVVGLRDPLAEDPRAILARSDIPADRVMGRWELYQALDPELVLTRARTLLRPPDGVSLRMRDGVLVATGAAPIRWVEESDRLAPMISGVQGFDRTGLVVFDVKALREQMEAMTLQFHTGTTRLLPGQDAELGRLVALLKQLNDAARSVGMRARVDLTGHTDSDGTSATNRPLSQARAELILASVPRSELPALDMTATGVGDEVPLSTGSTEAEKQRNRRVSIRVLVPDVGEGRRP
jgi:OOP family OmpA-OmpF porin